MSFHDFYHKYFGNKFGGYIRPPEGDGDDDEDNVASRTNDPFWSQDRNQNDIREFPSFFHFNVVTDPLEMHRFFEQKMGEVLSSFFSPTDGFPGLNGFGVFEPPNDPAAEEKQSLRDRYLKPGINKPRPNDDSSATNFNDPPWKGPRSWVESFQPPHEDVLDDSPSRPKIYSSYRSVVRKSVTLPDGSVKTEEIVRDSDGTERRTETHSAPDVHTGGLAIPYDFPNMSDFFKPNFPEMKKISPRDQYLKPGYESPRPVDDKIDKDLDIEIQEKGVESLPSLPNEPELTNPSDQDFSFKSVIRRTIKLPNGNVETEEVVRNSDGSEKRSVVRSLPDGADTSLQESLSDNLTFGLRSNHGEEQRNQENYSNLVKGINDFMRIFFK